MFNALYRHIVRLLKQIGEIHEEYPSELLSARRAAFIKQIASKGDLQ